MTIKFQKKTELSGKAWFQIWANNSCLASFHEDQEEVAKAYYLKCLESATNGGPITETLAEETFPDKS
jgi:hypothetical protein